ncbi:hypothetical protein ACHAWX_007653 [Stephanocyclus meneghinianus]
MSTPITPTKLGAPTSHQTQSSQKRKTRQAVQDEDIRCVSYPYSSSGGNGDVIVTPVVSLEVKQVLLDRLKGEIVSKLDGAWCRGQRLADVRRGGKKRKIHKCESDHQECGDDNSSQQSKEVPLSIPEVVVRSRFIVGINQCSRMLEKAFRQKAQTNSTLSSSTSETCINKSQINLVPSLIILARDVRPASIFAHIPIYAHVLPGVRVMILPGNASVEFGNVLGIKSVAAAMFLSPGSKPHNDGFSSDEIDAHNDIDAFINFAIANIPK